MTTDDLIFYIQNQLKKNVPKDLIVSRLSQVGWREGDIEEGFLKVLTTTLPVTKPTAFFSLNETKNNLSEEIIPKSQPTVKLDLENDLKIKIPSIIKSPIQNQNQIPRTEVVDQGVNDQNVNPINEKDVSKINQGPKPSDFLDNRSTVNELEINQPEPLVELNQINPSPNLVDPDRKVKDEEETPKPEINAREIEAPKNLPIGYIDTELPAQLSSPQTPTESEIKGSTNNELNNEPEAKIWTPMQIKPIEEEQAPSLKPDLKKVEEENYSSAQLGKSQPVVQPEREIKQNETAEELNAEMKDQGIGSFVEFIPKLIEKKSIKNVEPITTITPPIPSAPVAPITSSVKVSLDSTGPKKEYQTITPNFQPIVPLPPQRASDNIRRRERPSGLLDLSGGNKSSAPLKNIDIANQAPINLSIDQMADSATELSKKAMIASYSADYLSANLLKEKNIQTRNHQLPKSTIILIIVLILLGALTFGLVGGYLKIPNINFSFIRKDPKVYLLKEGGPLANVKSYKVETKAKISLSSLSNITASLLNGENMATADRDEIIVTTRGQVNKNGNYQSDFSSTIVSSIQKEGITINYKKDQANSYVTVSDFSKVFGYQLPEVGMIKLSKDKINLLSPKLPLGLADEARELEIYRSLLGGLLEENKAELSKVLGEFIKDAKIKKKGEETIRGSETYHYTISADKTESKKLFNQLIAIALKDTKPESRAVLDKLVGSINIDTFDIWLGQEDENIHKYNVTLKIPLSKVINYENKGISNSQIIFNLESTYYDFDVVNQITMPNESITIDQFLLKVKDSQIKEATLLFKQAARSLYNAEGSYGKKANQTGLCEQPEAGSLFSPVGHSQGSNTAVGELARLMNQILSETNNSGICYSTPKAWAMALPLSENPGQYYCIDSQNGQAEIQTEILLGTSCQ